MSIKTAIKELQAYTGPERLILNSGAGEDMLQAVELAYNITLPDDFKELYRFTDGFGTDEDMFNMIPLSDIIDNKGRHGDNSFYIAEYMIYCDMWELEIDPDNCNNYNIIIHANYNKLVLTQSLAEFITVFLKGGVFGKEGLYNWHDEVEKLPVYSTKLKAAEILLTVFYFGIRMGLVEKQEVTHWADQLIMHENEPEHFFIDLSLCRDKNEMLNLLNSVHVPNSPVVARAILALLYQRFLAGDMPVAQADELLYQYTFTYNFTHLLSAEEQDHIYTFAEYRADELIDGLDQLSANLLSFLSNYKDMQTADYKYWLGRSYGIAYNFNNGITETGKANERILYRQQKRAQQRHALLFATACMAAFVSLIITIIIYSNIAKKEFVTKFQYDLYQLCALYLALFLCYYLIKGVEWALAKIFRRRR